MLSASSVSANLSPEKIKNFQVWQRSFEKTILRRRLEHDFEELKDAGCKDDDLEWLLFSIAEALANSRRPVETRRLFFRRLDRTIDLANSLMDELRRLCTLTDDGSQVLGSYFVMMDLEDQIAKFNERTGELCNLSGTLDGLRTIIGGPPGKSSANHLATSVELLFIAYVREATRKNIGFRYDRILAAAVKAYGLEPVREYHEEAMLKRHNRFKKKNPREADRILTIASAYVNSKFFPMGPLPGCGLIPFYVASLTEYFRRERLRRLKREGHL